MSRRRPQRAALTKAMTAKLSIANNSSTLHQPWDVTLEGGLAARIQVVVPCLRTMACSRTDPLDYSVPSGVGDAADADGVCAEAPAPGGWGKRKEMTRRSWFAPAPSG